MNVLFKKLMYKNKMVIEQPLGNIEIEGVFWTWFARNLHIVFLALLVALVVVLAVIK